MKSRILIAEDDPLLRNLLAEILAEQEDFDVVGSVPTGQETVDASAELRPHVVLMDVSRPDSAALDRIEHLAALPSPPMVLILSADEGEATQLETARHGAHGFLRKSQGIPALTAAIRAVMTGEVWFTRQIVSRILKEHAALLRRVREHEKPMNQLSVKELDVLVRVARGLTNQQIADDLQMSISTVKAHVRNIFQKLNLPNRTEAAVFALREGLVEAVDHRHPSGNNAER
jgi:two-component system, NarL family, response regulator LiaR